MIIQINLLPPEIKAKRLTTKRWLTIGIVASVILINIIFISSLLTFKITSLNKELLETKEKIERYEGVFKKLEEVKKKKEKLQVRIDIISALMKYQKIWPVIFDELYNSLPETVWLKNFSSMSNEVKIEGRAFSFYTIADFLTRLKEISYFDNVELISAKKEKKSGEKEEEILFTISLSLKL